MTVRPNNLLMVFDQRTPQKAREKGRPISLEKDTDFEGLRELINFAIAKMEGTCALQA